MRARQGPRGRGTRDVLIHDGYGSGTTGTFAKGATGLNGNERRRLQRQEDRLREARADALSTAAERL